MTHRADDEELVSLSTSSARGSIGEFWLYFVAGGIFSIVPVAVAFITRSSLAARQGSIAGCGANCMVVLLVLAALVWARVQLTVPTVHLVLMMAAGIFGPVLLSIGSAGYFRVARRRSQMDFLIGVISSLVSFGVLLGATVVLLFRGLLTSM
jgi:hypothetical protein